MSEFPHDKECERAQGASKCFCWLSRAEADALVRKIEALDGRARLAEHRLTPAGQVAP